MILVISGLPGSGTTTAAEKVAQLMGLKLISVGNIFRSMAKQRGMTLLEFSRYAEEDWEVDRKIDEAQRKMVREAGEGCVVDSRLGPWIIPEADLKVLLFAPLKERARRVSQRDQEEVSPETILEREKSERRRYMEIYGFDPAEMEVFDIAINTHTWSADQVARLIVQVAKLRKAEGDTNASY